MTPRVYWLHGLRVLSQVPLHERLALVADPDVSITCDPTAGPAPLGEVVAELSPGNRVLYQVVLHPSGTHLLRFPGICDFEVSADLSSIRCRPDPAADHRLIPILLRGTVMAVLLDVRGAPTLHASAVEVGGRAIAFAGRSGSGKSTLAAWLCATGARLVTDDVLTIAVGEDGAWCPGGSAELRLRRSVTGLLDMPDWVLHRRQLADGRVAVRPQTVDFDQVPLVAVVLPVPSPAETSLTVREMRPTDALFRLAGLPRVAGWTCPAVIGRAFDHMVRVATTVPVFQATIPWGSPWSQRIADQLIDAVAGIRV